MRAVSHRARETKDYLHFLLREMHQLGSFCPFQFLYHPLHPSTTSLSLISCLSEILFSLTLFLLLRLPLLKKSLMASVFDVSPLLLECKDQVLLDLRRLCSARAGSFSSDDMPAVAEKHLTRRMQTVWSNEAKRGDEDIPSCSSLLEAFSSSSLISSGATVSFENFD